MTKPYDGLVQDLEEALTCSWSWETSADPEYWTPDNPSWGHSVLATLAASAVLGGEILCYDLSGTPFAAMRSHYKLRLEDGTILDFTEAQFQGYPIEWGEPTVRRPSELLDPSVHPENAETAKRYERFKAHIVKWFGDHLEEAEQ